MRTGRAGDSTDRDDDCGDKVTKAPDGVCYLLTRHL